MGCTYENRMKSAFQRFFKGRERIYKYDNERPQAARDTGGAYNFIFAQTASPLPCPPN
jgi:hypothetical protein